jgi:hypothetical protein
LPHDGKRRVKGEQQVAGGLEDLLQDEADLGLHGIDLIELEDVALL